MSQAEAIGNVPIFLEAGRQAPVRFEQEVLDAEVSNENEQSWPRTPTGEAR
jgi:hypothetical protein